MTQIFITTINRTIEHFLTQTQRTTALVVVQNEQGKTRKKSCSEHPQGDTKDEQHQDYRLGTVRRKRAEGLTIVY